MGCGLLQFYPPKARLTKRIRVREMRALTMRIDAFRAHAAACSIACAFVLAGCATAPVAPPTAPPAAPLPRNAEPPPPAVNLSGFPLAYRQGYADGCASSKGAERKDGDRFAADPNYRTGWMDGIALCRRK